MPETVTVYYDYLCPYAWRSAELCEMVTEVLGLTFRWYHFSIHQGANGHNGTQVWNGRIDPHDESGGRGLLPFLASCAARAQGEAVYRAFRLGAMRAYHRQGRPYTREVLLEVAEAAGAHMPSFERDLANPERRTILAHEHHQALMQNVNASPTFRFESGRMGVIRLRQVPCGSEAAAGLFQACWGLLEHHLEVESVHRARESGN